MKRRIYTLLMTTQLVTAAWGGITPDWLEHPVVPAGYLAAVGSAEIATSRSAAEHEALTSALATLAAQLQVDVLGVMEHRRSEAANSWANEFESDLRATSSTRLEGVEIADRFAGEGRLWIYVRIHEETWRISRQQGVERQRRLIEEQLDLVQDPTSPEAMALRSGAHAWAMVSMGEPAGWVAADWNDERQLVLARLCQRLARLELRPRRTTDTIWVEVRNHGDAADLSGLPLRLVTATTNRLLWTNAEGRVHVTTATLSPSLPATVQVRLDLQALTGASIDAQNLPVPTTRVHVASTPQVFQLVGRESYFGDETSLQRLRPGISAILRQAGGQIVDDGQAPKVIEIDVSAYRGSRVGRLVFVWLDLSITVYGTHPRTVSFRGTRSDIKGAGTDYDGAIAAALQQATGLLREAVFTSHERDVALVDSMGASLHP